MSHTQTMTPAQAAKLQKGAVVEIDGTRYTVSRVMVREGSLQYAIDGGLDVDSPVATYVYPVVTVTGVNAWMQPVKFTFGGLEQAIRDVKEMQACK